MPGARRFELHRVFHAAQFGVDAGIDDIDPGRIDVVQLDQIVAGRLRVGNDTAGRAGIMARAPAQMGQLPARMGLREVLVAQVMDGGDGRDRRADGDDMGRSEEHVRWPPAKFAAKPQVCPQPALQENDLLDAGRSGEQSAARRLIEVETQRMAFFGRLGYERADQLMGVRFRPCALGADGATGVNADDHRTVAGPTQT